MIRKNSQFRDTLAGASPIGHVSTLFRNETSRGVPRDEASSAFQKDVRRGNRNGAALALLEQANMATGERGARIMTIALRRALVTLFEDCAPHDPSLVNYVLDEVLHATIAASMHELREALVRIAFALAGAKKARILSHLKARYHSDEVRSWAEGTPYVALFEGEDPTLSRPYSPATLKAFEEELHAAFAASDMDAAQKSANGLLRMGANPDAKTMWDGDSMRLLYNVCCSYATDRDLSLLRVLERMRDEAKTFRVHRDRMVFALAPVIMCAASEPYTEEACEPTELEIDMLIAQHEGAALVVPDYAVDMHTARGRSMGRNALHFAEVGALVNNVSERHIQPALRDLYNAFKKHKDTNGKKRKRETRKEGKNKKSKN